MIELRQPSDIYVYLVKYGSIYLYDEGGNSVVGKHWRTDEFAAGVLLFGDNPDVACVSFKGHCMLFVAPLIDEVLFKLKYPNVVKMTVISKKAFVKDVVSCHASRWL